MRGNQKFLKNIGENNSGYAQAIGMVLAVLITILVGILIYYKVAGSMGIPSGGSTAATAVNNTANSVFTLAPIIGIVMIAGSMGIPSGGSTAATAVNNTANSVFTLAPIIGIVMIAGIILGIVMRFGRGDMV